MTLFPMLLQTAAIFTKKLLVDGKITSWVMRQIYNLGDICNKVLHSKTLSDEIFCFLGNVCYQYLDFVLRVKLLAADWPQSTSLKCIVIFLEPDWSTLSTWPGKRTSSQNDRNVIETFFLFKVLDDPVH